MVLLDILYLHVDLVCSCSSLALSFLYWPFYLESMYLIRFNFIWFDYLSIFQHIECLVCVVVNYVYCVHNVTSFLHFFAFTYHLSVYLVHLFLHCVVSKCFLLTLVGLTLMWPVVAGAGGFWSPGTNVHVSVRSPPVPPPNFGCDLDYPLSFTNTVCDRAAWSTEWLLQGTALFYMHYFTFCVILVMSSLSHLFDSFSEFIPAFACHLSKLLQTIETTIQKYRVRSVTPYKMLPRANAPLSFPSCRHCLWLYWMFILW